MESQFEWFTKFFTYSSIQVKIIATLLAFLVFAILRKVIIKFVIDRITDSHLRYKWQKTITYTLFILAFIIIGQVWFKGIQSIATYLGLLSAGIAIALKDPLTNMSGWLYILWRSPFEVGERIQLGKQAGDVIDISLFNFTLMEIGNWVDADQSTGRIIHVPNGHIFTQTLANYGRGFKYIWNEVPVLLTFESNWRKAKEILQTIASQHAAHLSKHADKQFKKASKRFLIHQFQLEPAVYTSVKEHGVELTLRYLCEPRKRRSSLEAVWESILTEFESEQEIDFAYPTMRRFNHRLEGKKKIPTEVDVDND